MKKRILALITSVCLIVSLCSCQSEEEDPKVLRFGMSTAPTGIFLEQFHDDTYNGYITYIVYEGLTQAGMDGRTELLLAKDVEVSEDGRTYTFTLQEDVTWHDGEPFTAEDVAFTYTFMSDPDYSGYYNDYVAEIEGYDDFHSGKSDELSGVTVIDPYTVSVTTTEVYASFLAKVGGIKIIPKHIWEDIDVAEAEYQTDLIQNPVGTGAFMLEEFEQNQYVALSANKDYWRGTPLLDEIYFVVVNDETAGALLEQGEIDYYPLMTLNEDDIRLYEEAGLTFNRYTDNSYQCLQVNQKNDLLAPVEVRQAFACAIDRQSMIDALMSGYGQVANTVYSGSFWANPGEEALSCYEYDPDEAVNLLASVGWQYDGERNVMSDPDGNPVTLRLFCPTGNEVREKSAVIIQDNLEQIGIRIDVEMMEFAALLDLLEEGSPDSYDLALTGYGVGADPDVSMLVETDGYANYGSFSDEEMDALLERAKRSPEEEEQAKIWEEVAVLASEKLPCVYLYNMDQGTVQNDHVVTVLENVYWDCYDSYLWDVQ